VCFAPTSRFAEFFFFSALPTLPRSHGSSGTIVGGVVLAAHVLFLLYLDFGYLQNPVPAAAGSGKL
jgi:hypothetical protein